MVHDGRAHTGRRQLGAMVLVLTCALSACENEGPSAPTATVSSVRVATSADLLRIGESLILTLIATLTDGSSQSVKGVWSADPPAIVEVAADGRVTARAPGEVNVVADYNGFRVIRRLRVVPTYDGMWFIEYRSTACEQSGDWKGGCANIDPSRVYTTRLTVQQHRDTVTGSIKPYIDIPSVPLEGQIAVDGSLTARGSVGYALPNCSESCQFEIVDLRVLPPDGGRISGNFTIRVSSPLLLGSRSWTSEFTGTTVPATSNLSQSVPAGGNSALGLP